MIHFSSYFSEHPRSSKTKNIKSQTWNVFFCCSSTATRDKNKKKWTFLSVISRDHRRMQGEFWTFDAHHFPSGTATAWLPPDFPHPSLLFCSLTTLHWKIENSAEKILQTGFWKTDLLKYPQQFLKVIIDQ